MSENNFFTMKQACKKLSLTNNQLIHWEKKLNLNITRNKFNNRIYSMNDINVFSRIKNLMDDGKILEEIQEILISEDLINNERVSTQDTPNNNINTKSVNTPEIQKTHDMSKITEAININNKYLIESIEHKFTDKLENIIELSEKYAKATYKIGSLESENKALSEKNLLISDNSINEVNRLKKELEEKKILIESLTEEKKELRNKLTLLSEENKELKQEVEYYKNLKWYQRRKTEN